MGFIEHIQSSVILGTPFNLPNASLFDLESINLFFHHINQNSHSKIIEMLHEGFNVDTPHYKTLDTPLIHAIKNNQEKLAHLLISYGANIYAQDKENASALYWALVHNMRGLITYLVHHHAYALQSASMKLETLELISKNQHSSLLTLSENIPVQPQKDFLLNAAKSGLMPSLIYHLQNPKNLHIVNSKEQSLLHLAIMSGSLPMVVYLLNRGISIDIQDKYGNFPLIYAVLFTLNRDIVSLLVKRGATLDQINKNENSALTMAIRKANFHAIELLCKNGANINHRDGIHTPLSLVHDQLNQPLDQESKKAFQRVHFYLSQHGAHVNVKGDAVGWTPLHLCTNYHDSKFYLDHMRKLIRLGANIDQKDAVGRTALMLAAGLGRTESVKLLLKEHASVNLLDRYGWSALMLAVYNNHFSIVKELIQAQANPNLVSHNGRLHPLKLAIEQKHELIELYLREHGANIEKN